MRVCVCVCVWLLLRRNSNNYCIFWACICCLKYPAYNAHALYCYLWHIFPHYLINGTNFGKYSLDMKCFFWFFVQFLSKTFLIPRRNERDIIVNGHRSSSKVPCILEGCQWNFNFIDRFSGGRGEEDTRISNFMKILYVPVTVHRE